MPDKKLRTVQEIATAVNRERGATGDLEPTLREWGGDPCRHERTDSARNAW